MRPSRVLPVVAACLLATACGAATTTAPDGDSPKQSAAAAPGKKKPAPKVAGIGSLVKDGKFTFKVTKAKNGPKQIGDAYLNHKPQGRFYFVYVTVKNHGDEAQLFAGDSQKLLAGGKEYSADGEAAIYLKDSKSLLTEVNPGNIVKGVIIYDIPKNVKPTAIELHDSPFSGGVKVSLAK